MTELQRVLLHIKSLVWCLSKASQRYNLSLIVACLSERRVLDPLRNTNLGDNLTYLLSALKHPQDLQVLVSCLQELPKSQSQLRMEKQQYEIGHYLEALEDLTPPCAGVPVPKGSYGIISWLKEPAVPLGRHIRGLFYVEESGLIETIIEPQQVRVIYGTMI
jgi:hypothetical protein